MSTRVKIFFDGQKMFRARINWNKSHPNDPISSGEVIHHKDGNMGNDAPNNLKKMSDFDHRSLHSSPGTEALKRWRKNHPDKARKHSQTNYIKLQEKLKNDPILAEKTRVARSKARIKSNKARKKGGGAI